jgi:hypothetical protein
MYTQLSASAIPISFVSTAFLYQSVTCDCYCTIGGMCRHKPRIQAEFTFACFLPSAHRTPAVDCKECRCSAEVACSLVRIPIKEIVKYLRPKTSSCLNEICNEQLRSNNMK